MNDKWWSFLFGAVMFACGALFVVAPIVGWWMPTGRSAHAYDIGFLFYLILAITGFFFILTEALLVFFMYRYAELEPGEVRQPSIWWMVFRPLTSVFNTSTKIEMAWTVVPAAILLYLAVAQIDTWADVKYKSRIQIETWGKDEGMPVQIEVSARQFEWRMRYPHPNTWLDWQKDPTQTKKKMEKWVTSPQFDDIRLPNELHGIKGHHVLVQLSTKDVIHSFNMPHMRIKQDSLPGKTIPVWFVPIDSNVTTVSGKNKIKGKDGKEVTEIVAWQDGGGRDAETGKPTDPKMVWEIACAELCGWGHYRMIGRAFIHDTEADFLAWLTWAAAHQNDFGKTK